MLIASDSCVAGHVHLPGMAHDREAPEIGCAYAARIRLEVRDHVEIPANYEARALIGQWCGKGPGDFVRGVAFASEFVAGTVAPMEVAGSVVDCLDEKFDRPKSIQKVGDDVLWFEVDYVEGYVVVGQCEATKQEAVAMEAWMVKPPEATRPW